MYKLTFITGAALGYVLGSRAGRARYDDLKNQFDALWHSPRVQEKVSAAGHTVKEKAPVVGSKLADAAGHAASAATHAAGTAKSKVTRSGNDDAKGDADISDTPHETWVQS